MGKKMYLCQVTRLRE